MINTGETNETKGKMIYNYDTLQSDERDVK